MDLSTLSFCSSTVPSYLRNPNPNPNPNPQIRTKTTSSKRKRAFVTANSPSPPPKPTRFVTFLGKGGSGKTTASILAAKRPPGALPSSMLGFEALTGGLDYFGFEDYLNVPLDSETLRPADMHHGMEVRLGLSKGPTCPGHF